jgi:transcriptional regulator with XRE-family HTH domain
MSVAEQFGRNLARCRKAAGLSQEDVCFLAGLHRTEISHLERGKRLPRVDTAAKLAAALKADPGELFEGIVWHPGELRPGRFELSKEIALDVPKARKKIP